MLASENQAGDRDYETLELRVVRLDDNRTLDWSGLKLILD